MTRKPPLRLFVASVAAFAVVSSTLLVWLSTTSAESVGKRTAVQQPSSSSLYQLESSWSTDNTARIRLRELGGRYLIVAMIFTRCPGVCPTLVRELQALQKSLPQKVSEKTGFLLVTIDPEFDTPAVLREYRQKMGLAADKWTLLRGEPNDLRELAATLGFDYQPNGPGGFAHSRLVTVLDPGGEVIHQQAEVSGDPIKLIAAIQKRI